MWELIKSGGWIMLPIVLCSIIAVAIVIERLWTLRTSRVSPPDLLAQVWQWRQNQQVGKDKIQQLRQGSPLGQILAAGLFNAHHGREMMKESIQEAGVKVVNELERYLTPLGTIAAITPLLGLLGTVLGMIEIFSAFMDSGMANAPQLAGGIAKALVTTAAGLFVAIPAVFFHRFLQRRVDELVVRMEQEAIKLVETIDDDRACAVNEAQV
ncbi:MotA/TolQ/ExbB proton channel family protein [Denitrificimonas sp. JX-1]|uniref:MotA/TolQ/ExbB proton channel family protein n=1 Tax=Denitrificimonas halotolerans TaxID=3098930 RepID=A0ABU5GM82_9GAMM|nr:MotA/TolQ/ExbB proton channel family protein [Denitrificimonas sp. JX-1]MDY7218002.1 MotA/TolQ/ExbB proton channel family protein [Denitrificimonas sp. JX-1]